MCVTEDSIWIFHGEINALFEYNLSRNTIEYKGSLSADFNLENNFINASYCIDETLLLIPRFGSVWIEYKIDKGIFSYFSVNIDDMIAFSKKIGNQLYLFPDVLDEYIYIYDFHMKKMNK